MSRIPRSGEKYTSQPAAQLPMKAIHSVGRTPSRVPSAPPSSPPNTPPTTPQQQQPKTRTQAPTGVQIVLTLPEGNILRERELPPL